MRGETFEVRKDDIFKVMRERLAIEDVEYYSREVEDAGDLIKPYAEEIEECAEAGETLDEQTEYAHDKIEELLRELVYG